MSESRPTVVIIGGGVSGLVALRHLKDVATVILYEGRSSIGGLWALNTDSAIDRAEEGNLFQATYSCHFRNIFDDLVMNTPSMFAQFKDLPHEDDCPSFFTREQFSDYIVRYADKFKLHNYIRTNTFVLDVRQVANLKPSEIGHHGIKGVEKKLFVVKTCNSNNTEACSYIQADYVIVANGHNHAPNMPVWTDSALFDGQIIHSRDFRRPNDPAFSKKTILIVGAGSSGYEMLVQFFAHPIYGESDIKKLYFCGKTAFLAHTTDFMPWIKSGKLELIEGTVASLKRSNVNFTNGLEVVGIDTIIACTGYKFAFPFLEKENIISLDEGDMYYGPLYKQTFCANNPHMCFVGNIDRTCHIQKITEMQCMVIKSFVSGNISLPDKEEMLADLEKDLLDFPGDKRRDFLKPFCASEENMKIICGLYQLLPELRKYEKFIKTLNDVGKVILSEFLNGNLLTVRATEYREYFPNFEWDET